MTEIGIEGVIDNPFITYCCPEPSIDKNDKTTGPFADQKGKVPGCTVLVSIGGGSVPEVISPGICKSVSAFTAVTSSASYWSQE